MFKNLSTWSVVLMGRWDLAHLISVFQCDHELLKLCSTTRNDQVSVSFEGIILTATRIG